MDEFLSEIKRPELRAEISDWSQWKKLRPLTFEEKTPAPAPDLHSFRTKEWVKGGIFCDVAMQLAVQAGEQEAERVEAGIQAIRSADDFFKQIAASVIALAEKIEAISVSIGEMDQGSRKMAESIQLVNKIGGENSGEVESVSAAAEEQSASMAEPGSRSRISRTACRMVSKRSI